MNNTYKCARCGKEFEKGWNNEESNKEAKEYWGIENASDNSDMAIICDDCWKIIMNQ